MNRLSRVSMRKSTLQQKDIRLTLQLQETDQKYRKIYNLIDTLSEKYERCKRRIPPWRYKNLKDMIKRTMYNADAQAQAIKLLAQKQPQGILKSAENFSETCANYQAVSDAIQKLHKAELEQDVEEKQKIRDGYKTKLIHLHDRLNELERDYVASKQMNIFRRYRVLKHLIKRVISDEGLRPEEFEFRTVGRP